MGNDGDAAEQPVHLSGALGPLGIAFLTFSALSPAVSVYIFGAGVIHFAGTGAVIALLIGGLLAALIGLLYAEISSAFPDAGGVFPAFVKILGPTISFPYIVLMIFVLPALIAFGVLGFATNLQAIMPSLPKIPLAIVCLVAAGSVAILNVKTGAHLTGAFLAIEMAALLVITVIALLHPERALVQTIFNPVTPTEGGLTPTPPSQIGLAVIAGLYCCTGANWATYFAQEMVGANKRIGRLISWISPLAALTIAGPMILALLSAPDIKAMLESDVPIAAYLQQTTTPAVATFINVGVLFALFNAIIATLMGCGRLVYATARDGFWPMPVGDVLGTLHPRFHSPVAATTAFCVIAMIMMALSEQRLLLFASNQMIVEFILLGTAVLVGRRRGQTGIDHRVPLHPVLPILAILVAAALAAANWVDLDIGRPSLYVLAAIVIGSLGYRFLRRAPTKL
jgi:fructoselysine transporter